MRHFVLAIVALAVGIAASPSLAFAQHGHGHGSYGHGGYGHEGYSHGYGGYGHGGYSHGGGRFGLDVHVGPIYPHSGGHGHQHAGRHYFPVTPAYYYSAAPVYFYPTNPAPLMAPVYPQVAPPPASQGGSVPIAPPQSINGNGAHVPGKVLPYGGQKTCPVTGEDLGSHGAAIPVAVQGQTIYVCCESCVNAVRRNPGQYLPKVEAERKASAR
ncbi:MAG: hypothetical protein HYX68_14850 [Planctomycetes bacterium]|nr:hypothetical protein [Planctomycetota bacterium]